MTSHTAVGEVGHSPTSPTSDVVVRMRETPTAGHLAHAQKSVNLNNQNRNIENVQIYLLSSTLNVI